MQETQQFKTYDLSSFERHYYPGKPYWSIDAKDQQQHAQLSRLLSADFFFKLKLKAMRKDIKKAPRGKFPANGIIGFTGSVIVGQTPLNQYILIVVEGLFFKNNIPAGGWQVFVCEPEDVEQLSNDRHEEMISRGDEIRSWFPELRPAA
jgi:hypothetical protein